MSLARIDQVMDRYLEASTTEDAEAALRELAELDAADPGNAAEHELIGDLYAELASDLYEQDEYEEAVRLQRLSIDQPCTNALRELGTLLGYRFAAGDRGAVITELGATRRALAEGELAGNANEASDAGDADEANDAGDADEANDAGDANDADRANEANEANDAGNAIDAADANDEIEEGDTAGEAIDVAAAQESHLVGAFAEAVERVDGALANSLHDEAVALADASGDEDVLAVARVPRALLRRDLDLPPDADDIEAFRELESLGQRLEAGGDAEAVQLFLPRDELALAAETWPAEVAELGLDDPDAFYRELELFWREWPAAGGAIVLRPLTVALLQEHGSSPGQPADDMPDALVEALEARDDGEAWPPGRNDPCWCGSARKYKKCCGAA